MRRQFVSRATILKRASDAVKANKEAERRAAEPKRPSACIVETEELLRAGFTLSEISLGAQRW